MQIIEVYIIKTCASFLSNFETDLPIDEPDPDPNYASPVDTRSQQTLPDRLDPAFRHEGVLGYVSQREGTVNASAFEQEGVGEDGLEGIRRYRTVPGLNTREY